MAAKLPNFFIIGAAKSGTTSLHEYLDQHPDIHMSFPKELNFFSFPDSVPDFSGPYLDTCDPVLIDRLRREKYQFSVTTWPEYKKVFARVGSANAIGESSVSYLYFPGVAERIQQFAQGARFIAILRNPVDRAYSKYRQLRRDGAEPLARFEQAVAAEATRMREKWSPAWFYIDRGFYYRQLKRYYNTFDSNLIHVILYEDFTNNPREVLQKIFIFLDVDASFHIDSHLKHNASDQSSVPRSMFLYTLIARPTWFSRMTKAALPKKRLAQLRPLFKRSLSKRKKAQEAAPLTGETRQDLIEVFREDILQLQDLIQRDLSSWL